jgi:hypothetical protein
MTRALTRTPIHSSRLLRILTDLACLQAPATGAAFAEQLGLWVDYTQAIALCAVHNARPTQATEPEECTKQAPAGAAVCAAFARQRSLLERTLRDAKLPALDLAEAAQLATGAGPAGPGAADITAAFEPYRRNYLAQQRDWDLKLPPLRSQVRDLLAQASAPLQQLAALDAALEEVLAARESRLLGALPQLLKQRFVQLLNSYAPQQPGAWLAHFRHEMQTILLAELDLRLQPALGLVEALASEWPSELPSEPTLPPCTV